MLVAVLVCNLQGVRFSLINRNKMKIKYRKGVVSDCGLYYSHNGAKYWYTPSQHDYIVISFHSIMRRFDVYNRFRAYIASVNHLKGLKGMLAQAENLLIINPNHYYRLNIIITIRNYEENIVEQEKKINNYSKIFRVLYS